MSVEILKEELGAKRWNEEVKRLKDPESKRQEWYFDDPLGRSKSVKRIKSDTRPTLLIDAPFGLHREVLMGVARGHLTTFTAELWPVWLDQTVRANPSPSAILAVYHSDPDGGGLVDPGSGKIIQDQHTYLSFFLGICPSIKTVFVLTCGHFLQQLDSIRCLSKLNPSTLFFFTQKDELKLFEATQQSIASATFQLAAHILPDLSVCPFSACVKHFSFDSLMEKKPFFLFNGFDCYVCVDPGLLRCACGGKLTRMRKIVKCGSRGRAYGFPETWCVWQGQCEKKDSVCPYVFFGPGYEKKE